MTFPASPANGATSTVNGILYIYDSSKNSWKRSPASIGDIQANLGTATTNITTLFSNAATQATSINTTNANVGTLYLGNVSTNANLGAYQTYANSVIYSNSNVTSYLTSNTSGLVSDTSSIQLPKGTTAQRPVNPQYGAARFNTDINGLEVYTSAGWKSLAAPPTISTVSPTTYSGASGTEFIINGEAFTSDAQVYFVTANSTALLAATTSFYSAVQIRATTPRAITVAEEPVSVRVVQQSGTVTKTDCVDAGGVPAWVTAAGTLGSIFGANTVNVALSATDPDGNAIVYSIASGSLPGGLSLTSGNGVINGTASSVLANTTYNFTIRASDTINNTDRAFSYTVLNRPPVINTAPGSLGTVYSGNAVPSANIDAYDPDGGTITYDVASGSLPANTSLGSANGAIQGSTIVVTSNTTYTFSIRATDQGSGVASSTYTYTILNRPPLWNTAASLSSFSSTTFTPITINAYDPDGGSVTYSLTSGSVPSGLSFITANATIAGTPDDVSDDTTSTFTVTATDVGSDANARTFSLTITPIIDPYFANTTVSLKTIANTAFKDTSSTNLSATIIGDSRANNFSPYNSSWSAYFNGSSCIRTVSNANLAIGTGDVTIDFWMNTFVNSNNGIFGTTDEAAWNSTSWSFKYSSSAITLYNGNGGGDLWSISTGTLHDGNWHHVAIVRSSGTWQVFVDGVSKGTTATQGSRSLGGNTWRFAVGCIEPSNSDLHFTGFISNFRLNNTALYSANFTPSTTSLTAVSGTKLLVCQSARFVDNSLTPLALTGGSFPQTVGYSPFTETDTTTGSVYFDSSGDYLTFPNDTALSYNSTFSAEIWYYSTHTSCTDVIPFSGNGNWDFIIPAATTVAFRWFYPGYGDTGAHTMIPSSWNHIAVSVSGGRLSFYLNGTRMYTNASVSFTNGGSDTSKIGYGSNSIMKGYISNVRVTRGSTPYDPTQTTITVPTSPLTAISGTTFLTLQNRQPHNNHGFQDDSTNKFLITRTGNATQGTFTPFSQTGWSNYVGVASNYLGTSQPLININDWTVEFWIYPESYVNGQGVFGCSNGGGGQPKIAWQVDGANLALYVYNGGFYTALTYTCPTVNQWTFVSITRSSTTGLAYMHYNGALVISATYPAQTGVTSGFQLFTNGEGGTSGFYGYLSDFRVSNVARYNASSYSVPTAPLTAISGTILLTCQSNRHVDNSSNGLTLTAPANEVARTPSVQAFSPYAPTTSYSTTNNGGSAYLDGSGDYLTIGSGTDVNLSTSDFSMEFWYYCTGLSTYAPGLFCKRTGGVATGWTMLTSGFVCLVGGTWYDSWSTPYWVGAYASGGFNNSTSLTKLNQWTHVVVTRQGTDARWFVNGKLLGYQSRSGAIDHLTAVPLAVGFGGATSEQPYTGYISGGRISVGSVPTGYQTSSTTTGTQVFTPPTSPVTLTSQGASSGAVVTLLNFNKSAIVDYTSKNVFETVGDTKANNVTYKFSPGAISLDGSGDYIQLANPNATVRLGNGNFTIEMWANFGSSSGTQVLNNYGYEPGGTYSYVFYYTSGTIHFAYSTTGGSGGSSDASLGSFTPTVGTWYHIALVRNGSTVTCYVNGTALSSTINISTNTIYYPGTAGAFRVGVNASDYFTGTISDFRISKSARYTANFTAPTRSFPNR